MDARKPGPPPPDFNEDAPILTPEEAKELRPAREWFAEQGIPMPVPRGRPKAEATKKPVTIRLDEDVIEYFKAGGSGWQTRINDVLKREVKKSA